MPGLPMGEKHPWLAPLSGFSDLPFRILCRRLGCSVAFTEMVSAKGIVYRSIGCQRIINTNEEDKPLVVQLFGSEPQTLKEAVLRLKDSGFGFFDLNAGCPVKKVIKTGSGAALLKDVKRLLKILEEMVKAAGESMVGVKMRSGWYEKDRTFIEVGKEAKNIGIGWITLHPRSAIHKFSGTANWNHLRELQEVTSVPVIASGDLFTVEDARRCLEYTKVKGIMFARGALQDPAIFEKFLNKNSRKDLEDIIKMHIEIIKKYAKESYDVKRLRGILARYLKNFPFASLWRKKAMEIRTWKDVDQFIEKFTDRKVRYGTNSNQGKNSWLLSGCCSSS